MPSIFLRFPYGKTKSLTLSYDDGVEQNIRLIEIMNKHGLKGTFNINSGLYAQEGYIYSMLSAISNKGTLRFIVFDENMTQQKLIEFMARMIKDVDQKVYLILDNLIVHHGKLVKEWLAENRGRL